MFRRKPNPTSEAGVPLDTALRAIAEYLLSIDSRMGAIETMVAEIHVAYRDLNDQT